jgi:DNA-binding transcriptional MerR regulator
VNLDVSSPVTWIQLGATGLLAMLVLLKLRDHGMTLASVRELLAAILERDRIRSERRREPSEPPPNVSEFDAEQTTGLHDIMQRQQRSRLATPSRGIRTPRPGTHSDKP